MAMTTGCQVLGWGNGATLDREDGGLQGHSTVMVDVGLHSLGAEHE